jgi:O-glycosyl hydrolase
LIGILLDILRQWLLRCFSGYSFKIAIYSEVCTMQSLTRKISGLILTVGCMAMVSAIPINVDWTDVRRQMDGFGAFGGYGGYDTWTDEQADILCDSVTGAGLTIFRFQMPNDMWITAPSDHVGSIISSIFGVVDKAKQRGVNQFLVTSFSPQPEMKSNNSFTGGGTLLREHYQDYADYLAAYIDTCNAYGCPIMEPRGVRIVFSQKAVRATLA